MGNFTSTDEPKDTEILRSFFVEEDDIRDFYLWSPEKQSRLRSFNNFSVIHYSNVPSFEVEFEKFKQAHPTWNDQHTCYIFRFPDCKILVQQKSGLCCLIAPILLQYYLVSIHQQSNLNYSMIDLKGYITENWKGKRFIDYILHENAGNSIMFFEEINEFKQFSSSKFTIPSKDSPMSQIVCKEISRKVVHMPALVSNFCVDRNFFSSQKVSFLDDSMNFSDIIGLHSMILVGIRESSEYGHVFLLQNFWEHRFFIEVSVNYLHHSEAIITFVETEISIIPSKFPLLQGMSFVEFDVDIGEKIQEF